MRLRAPDPEYAATALPWFHELEPPGGRRAGAVRALTGRSRLARWLDGKVRALFPTQSPAFPPITERTEVLAARPGYEWILDGWRPAAGDGFELLRSEEPPPVFAEALEFTAWSLAEFKRRADRDGAALAVLSAHVTGSPASRWNTPPAPSSPRPYPRRHDRRSRYSLGLLCPAFASCTGFRVDSGEHRMTGLAPYGEPKCRPSPTPILEHPMDLEDGGTLRLSLGCFG